MGRYRGDIGVSVFFQVHAETLYLPYISPTSPLHLPCISPVSPYIFQVLAETRWGDTLVLVGSLPQLGAWDPLTRARARARTRTRTRARARARTRTRTRALGCTLD